MNLVFNVTIKTAEASKQESKLSRRGVVSRCPDLVDNGSKGEALRIRLDFAARRDPIFFSEFMEICLHRKI